MVYYNDGKVKFEFIFDMEGMQKVVAKLHEGRPENDAVKAVLNEINQAARDYIRGEMKNAVYKGTSLMWMED